MVRVDGTLGFVDNQAVEFSVTVRVAGYEGCAERIGYTVKQPEDASISARCAETAE
ncbi:MAG: hypothetical protein Alpg2KO_17160 [Alphaproteobacteria bacterium]